MAPDARSPSIYDVADAAGVSHQTVSRVLNGYQGIREATRERVLAAMAELGYRPNAAARSLAHGRSGALGILTPVTTDFGPVTVLHAAEAAMRSAGFQPLITSTPLEADAVRQALELLRDRSVEGVLAIAPYRVVLDALGSLGDLPAVAVQTGSDGIDQDAAARLVAQHLAELGHRRVQQVTGPADFAEATVRSAALSRAFADARLAEAPVLAGDWSSASGYAAAAVLDPTATAVVCANDGQALGLLHALWERGVSVPAELSVVGFDDAPQAAHAIPPLTTVRQDFAEVGRRAVARLVREVGAAPTAGGPSGAATSGAGPSGREPSGRGPSGAEPGPVAPHLVIRSSTAAPPHPAASRAGANAADSVTRRS